MSEHVGLCPTPELAVAMSDVVVKPKIVQPNIFKSSCFENFFHLTLFQEVTNYHEKVREFESKQKQLCQENEELRQLCLYLDEQRQMWMQNRLDIAENCQPENEDDLHSEDMGESGG